MVAEREGPRRGPRGCSAPEEFAAFFKQHRGVVFRTILAKTMDAAAAEDATAEAFVCAYAHWDDTVAAHPHPEAWVLKVAWNQHLSWWRAWGSRRAAEDLTGTVFAAAVEDLPGFRGEVDRLGGWLFRIARHDLYDYRRRVARADTERLDDVLDEAALAEDAPDLQDLVERLESSSRVMAALEQLSTDQREVLLLRLAAGLTVGEAAATLGKTTGAVKALQHRGLASLARKLEPTIADQRQDDDG